MSRIVPTFARVEIRIVKRTDLLSASAELRGLANELDFIAGSSDDDNDTLILAYHRIKSTSQKLRSGAHK